MNYKIDIDVIYGIKPRKYQGGGSVVGNNNTPLYSGEGWHSNLLIPNFRAPYILYFVNPNNRENTYVLLGAARDANLPFVADTATSASGAYFDYSPNTLVGGEPMDPNTTYLAVDPYGKVINTSAASIILNGKDMIPIDDSWVYDPNKGGWWQIPQLDLGQIYDADEIARRNSLLNLNEEFGLATGALVPLGANPELLDASMSASKSLLRNIGVGGLAITTPVLTAPLQPIVKPMLTAAGILGSYHYGNEAINDIRLGNYKGAIKNASAATVSSIPGLGTGWKAFTLGVAAPVLMSAADAENTIENKIKELKQGSGELSEEDLKYIKAVLSDMGLQLRDVNNVQGRTIGKMITTIPQNPGSHNDVTYIPWGTLGIGAIDVTANELVPRIGPKAAKFILRIREVAKKVFKTRYPLYLVGAGLETGGRYLYNHYNASPLDLPHEYNEIDIISDIAAILRNRTNWDISIEGLPPGKYNHNFGLDFLGSRNDTVDYLPPLRTRVWDQSQNNQSTQTSSTYPENKKDSALMADEPDTDTAL